MVYDLQKKKTRFNLLQTCTVNYLQQTDRMQLPTNLQSASHAAEKTLHVHLQTYTVYYSQHKDMMIGYDNVIIYNNLNTNFLTKAFHF